MRREGKTKPPRVDKRKVDALSRNFAIKVYENTDLVRIKVKGKLYEQLVEEAKRLETTPEKLIYSAILLILERTP